MSDNTFKAPWKACLNVPTATIPGHIIKVDDDVQLPIASIWEGGGTHGKPFFLKVAHLISAAPELLSSLKKVTACLESYVPSDSSEHLFVKQALAVIAKAEGKKPRPVKAPRKPSTKNKAR